MKNIILFILIVFTVGVATAQEMGQQRGPQYSSPVVEADRKVTFKVHSPEAKTITLNGSWMEYGQTVALTKGAEDVWSVTVGPLESTMYHYNFFIDGVSAI